MDDPSLTFVGGGALTPESARRLAPGVVTRLMVDRPAIRPIDVGDVVEVVPGGHGRPGDVVLCVDQDRCELGRLIHPDGATAEIEIGPDGARRRLAAGAVLGIATALEQGDLFFDLSRGRWRAAGRLAAALPSGLGSVLVVLAWLERLRHPFFPPLFMGSQEQMLARLTTAYDAEAEVIGRETELLPEEQVLLERHLAPGRRLLDVGCGAGREAIGFARAGIEVVGIDVAPAMIALARERAGRAELAIEFAVAEPLTLPADTRPFHAIYFSPGIYSHIPGKERRVRTMARLRDLLAPGGFIVVGPVLAPPLRALSRVRLVDALRRVGRLAGLRRLAEPGDHFYRGHALDRAPIAYRYIHRFRTSAEAEAELAEAGLVVSDRLDVTWWIVRRRA
ncbi:MAG TPA: class I SAM-dependent methyltransferase [Candidatus Polarisedimenticolaceae bacterium]|nr:class I SAM-dependent methyltransferase [Candidatus Polarisedimenticolaceae bacterium]